MIDIRGLIKLVIVVVAVICVIKWVILPDVKELNDAGLVRSFEVIIMFILFTNVILKDIWKYIVIMSPKENGRTASEGINVGDYFVLFLVLIASISVYRLLVEVVLDGRFVTRILSLIRGW